MAKGPSSLNLVSALLVLAAAGGIYGAWKFFPVYWTAWNIDHLLGDGAAQAYRVQQIAEPARSSEKDKLVGEIRRKVVQEQGIRDPEMTVSLDIEGGYAILHCDYKAVVFHPWGKFTILPMHRSAKMDLKKPQWE